MKLDISSIKQMRRDRVMPVTSYGNAAGAVFKDSIESPSVSSNHSREKGFTFYDSHKSPGRRQPSSPTAPVKGSVREGAVKGVGPAPADATIKQAYALFKNKVRSMRKAGAVANLANQNAPLLDLGQVS